MRQSRRFSPGRDGITLESRIALSGDVSGWDNSQSDGGATWEEPHYTEAANSLASDHITWLPPSAVNPDSAWDQESDGGASWGK